MEIKDKLNAVPFGNSQFQIANFIANQDSPERTYRAALINWDKKNQALKECSFRRKRKEIDIVEIQEKLKTSEGFEKQRLEIDLEECEYYLEHEIKLIEDCIIEMKTYEAILSKLPDFTREQFELSEINYWRTRLFKTAKKEIEAIGTVKVETRDALEQIGISVNRNNTNGKHEITYKGKDIIGIDG